MPVFYEPSNDDEPSVATAEVAMDVREAFYAEANIDDSVAEIASWLVATGNVFLVTYFDDDEKHGTAFVQHKQCATCGAMSAPSDIEDAGGMCPACAEQGMQTNSFTDATSPEGEPIGDERPVGKLCADVCSPFEIRLDHRVRRFEDQKRFIRMRRYDVDEAKQLFDLDDVLPDNGQDLSQYYLDVLSQVTGSFSASSGGFIGGGPSSPKNPKVTAYEFWELPTDDFPDGLHVIQLGTNKLVMAGPLETEVTAGQQKGKKFLPLAYFKFDNIPGRLWGKTRMDDMIPLQIFRNTIEANLRLSTQRMGNAIWLDPKGSGVTGITGEPGQKVVYNPVSMGGSNFAKPERIPAELSNFGPLLQMMNKCDDSMERVSGTFFLQGGDTPPGVTAASALAYLGERAQKSMSPLMHEWAKGWKRWEEQSLEIVRTEWNDARMRVVAGRNRKWEVKKFTSADLQGAVTIRINYEGIQPKSLATERATIGQLVQLGALNPADPETKFRILEKFGETNMQGSTDLDVRFAQKEADKFLTIHQAPVLRPMVDNSAIHIMYHSDFAKTDEFFELPQDQQDLWLQHIQNHVSDIVQRAQAMQMAGLNVEDPQFAELTTGNAQLMAQMSAQAAAQNGGVPNGAQGPDARLTAGGSAPPQPPQPADLAAGPPPTEGGQSPAYGPGTGIQTPRVIGQ